MVLTVSLMPRLVLLTAVLLVPLVQGKQDTTYVFSFLYNNYNSGNELTVYITSTAESKTTTGRVMVPIKDLTYPFSVEPGSSTMVTLSTSARPTSTATQDSTIFVKTDEFIYVIGYAKDSLGADSFTPLPTERLGTEYYLVTIDRSYNSYFPTFTITSLYDDTLVEIYYNEQFGDYNRTQPQEVEFASLKTFVGAPSFDFTGTRITSNKPVSVSSGHECAFSSDCDHVAGVLPPVDSWGKTFVTTTFTGRVTGYSLRILAAYPNTVVTYNGISDDVPIGGSLDLIFPLSTPILLESNQPVQVVSYVSPRPFMTYIPALEQAIRGPLAFYAIYIGGMYLTVWTSTLDYINVLIDDQRVDWDVKVLPGGNNGCLLQTAISTGYHVLRHSDPQTTFVGTVYGISSTRNYAHPLPYQHWHGEDYEDITPPAVTFCHSVPVEGDAVPDSNVTTVTWLEPSASDENGTPLTMASDWTPGDSFPVGNTTVTYTFTDESGNQAECTFDVFVHDVTPPVPTCSGYFRIDDCSSRATVSLPEPEVWDNSGQPVTVTTHHEGRYFEGRDQVQYTFTDQSGNNATCTVVVEVIADSSLCGDLTTPYIITTVILGLLLVPLIMASGLIVSLQRSEREKPPKEPKKIREHRRPPAPPGHQPPVDGPEEEDIYEDTTAFDNHGADFQHTYMHTDH